MGLEHLVEAGGWHVWELCCDGFVGYWRVLFGGWAVVDALSLGSEAEVLI